MAYVKLDTGILNSTLWIERECREIFITALLMAEPRDYAKPLKQIAVRTLDYTGWEAPPGWYGYVPAAGIGIIARSGLDREAGLAALEKLGSPETESRNPQFEGRRLIRIDGGYAILNYMRYRDKDHTAAERQAKLRARRKAEQALVTRDVDKSHRYVALPSRNITQSDADADAELLTNTRKTLSHSAHNDAHRPKNATHLPDDFALTEERRAYAVSHKIDPEATLIEFRDYWLAASGAKARKRDWDATWRTWCRRAADSKTSGARLPKVDDPVSKIWFELCASDGRIPTRTPRIQAAIDSCGGWSKIKARTAKDSIFLEKQFIAAWHNWDQTDASLTV